MIAKFFARPAQYRPLEIFKGARRILVIGEYWQGATARGYAQAFRELGFDVIDLDINYYFPQFTSVAGRFIARFLTFFFINNYNVIIKHISKNYNLDFVLFIKGNYVTFDTISKIKQNGAKSILIYPDVNFEHPGIRINNVIKNDYIFSTKKFHVDYFFNEYRKKIYHLNHGFYVLGPNIHNLTLDDEYQWDICYIGNYGEYKSKWVEHIINQFPEKRIAIVGNGWKNLKLNEDSKKYVFGYPVSGDRLSYLISNSKVNIAFHFGAVGTLGWKDDISLRSFQIPSIGGFMLHIDSEEIRALYAVPGDVDVFSTTDELTRKIDYYLGHPDERFAMARRAKEKCLQDDSLVHRAQQIFAIVDGAGG